MTFADGTTQEFTDPNQYLQTIKEELPLRNTTGFKHETLSEDPEIKKAVDDILLDFAGEENPRRTCNYGLTEKGLQALRDVADPSLPHSYAWFVMTDCNTPQEQLHRNLTLDEAVELYQNSDHPEKRLGVTKDDFATVDFVRMVDGEQTFFGDYQKLESFKNDPTIFEAVEQLHQELEDMQVHYAGRKELEESILCHSRKNIASEKADTAPPQNGGQEMKEEDDHTRPSDDSSLRM